jgi:hypothetical protein
MRSVLVRGITRGVGLFGVAALLGMLIVPNALAQMQRQPLRWNPESNPDPRDLTRAVSSEFDLFGDADLAWIGTRGRGSMRHSFTNDGPADYYFVGQGSILSELNAPAGFSQIYFEGGLWAGTPQSEWNKHRQAVPELNNVTGGGWTQSWNLNAWFLRYPTWWKPADGALGQIHSGVAATDDGSCRDFTSEGINTGSPLGASSDCPDTWGTDQFAGASRLIEFQSWVDYFNAVGGANFTWDWWQVPPEYVTDELIGDWQTYGKIVDWAADNMARFGNAVPGGVGTPEAQGYPMGLSLVWDAFSFANPDVANVTYWRALLINESEQAYGVPLDYDSLYFGNSKGILMNAQAAAQYARPDMAGVFINVNGTNPNCNNAITGNGVPACRYGVDDDSGFGRGAHAILVLNSPIGDLRNKLFSKTVAGTDCAVGTDPFCFPGHPRAGDTLTFNQHRQCDYGGCWANTTNRSARSGFGMHAGIAADMFDGRAPGDFDAGSNWWRTFHNYDYPTRTAAWNRWVPPGNWDWNHDGVLDTLTLESCIGPEFGGAGTGGCSELWSDTLPGRLNNRQGNFGGFVGVGPFPLAAGDTTLWTLA